MKENENTCLNCNNEFTENDKFCPACSQKTRSGRITVREYLADFFNEVFNLNSKLFKTLAALFVPGKLTKEFFLGKRKSYAPPIRLFLVMLIIFFGVESYMGSSRMDSNILRYGTRKKAHQDMIDRVDYLSKELKEEYKDENTDLIDTLNHWFKYMPDQEMTYNFMKYNYEENRFEKVNLLAEDIANLSDKELNEKYGFEGRLNQALSRQMKKFVLDPSSLTSFFVGSMTWMVFLLLPAMAGLFKLFYRKKDFYFVEHLVFLYHVHSFTLLLAIVMWLGYGRNLTILNTILIVAIMLYWLFSLKNVYQDSWGKTILKSGMILFSYVLAFTFLMAIFILISFLLF